MARLPEARSPSFVGFSRDMFLEAAPCTPLAQLPDRRIAEEALLCSSFMPAVST